MGLWAVWFSLARVPESGSERIVVYICGCGLIAQIVGSPCSTWNNALNGIAADSEVE